MDMETIPTNPAAYDQWIDALVELYFAPTEAYDARRVPSQRLNYYLWTLHRISSKSLTGRLVQERIDAQRAAGRMPAPRVR